MAAGSAELSAVRGSRCGRLRGRGAVAVFAACSPGGSDVSLRASTVGCYRLAFYPRLRGPGRRLAICASGGTRLGLDLASGARPPDVAIACAGFGANTRELRQDDQQRGNGAPHEFSRMVGGKDPERAVAVGERDQGG